MEEKYSFKLFLLGLYILGGGVGVLFSFAVLETWIAILILIAYGISILTIYAISEEKNKKKNEI